MTLRQKQHNTFIGARMRQGASMAQANREWVSKMGRSTATTHAKKGRKRGKKGDGLFGNILGSVAGPLARLIPF